MDIDEFDNIFVGWEGDIGFLQTDTLGKRTFKSYKELIPENLSRDFFDVWYTKAIPGHAYFLADSILLHVEYDQNPATGKISAILAPKKDIWATLLEFENAIFVQTRDKQFFKVVGDSLIPRPIQIPNDTVIRQLFRVDGDTLVSCWGEPYVAFLEGDYLKSTNWDVLEYAEKYIGRDLSRINDELFCLTFEEHGAAVINKRGEVIRLLNQDVGLSDETVIGESFPDRQGGLWLPLDYGLARVMILPEMSKFNYELGLRGGVHRIRMFNGQIYVATMQGLFALEESSKQGFPAKFHLVQGCNTTCWDMLPLKDRLLLATAQGVKELLASGQVRMVKQLPYDIQSFVVLPDSSTIAVSSYYNGLHLLKLEGNRWITRRVDAVGLTTHIGPMAIDKNNNLWINADWDHLERISVHSIHDDFSEMSVQVYDSTKGVPSGECQPFLLNGCIYLSGVDGLYEYDESEDCFIASDLLGDRFKPTGDQMSFPHVDPDGNLWFSSRGFYNPRVSFSPDNIPTFNLPLAPASLPDIRTLYFDRADNTIWAGGGGNTLIRYHGDLSYGSEEAVNSIITGVYANKDSLLFGGLALASQKPTILKYDDNTVRFEFAIPAYDTYNQNRYQYRLVGQSSAWSEWTKENIHEYSGLREGKYRFEVRGRDGYQLVGKTAEFSFRVLPPWYRSMWVYLLYLLLIAALILGLIQWRLGRLERERVRLQKLVEERSRQIVREQDRAARARLEAEQVKRTNQIAATIAHEFNNPLAIIQGCADLLADDALEDENRKPLLEKIPTQVQRMHGLVQKLLTLKHVEEIEYTHGLKIIDLQKSIERDRKEAARSDEAEPSDSNEEK